MTAERPLRQPDADAATPLRLDPIFVAGPDRSGTTLMYGLLASHPAISMVRRTNLWRYFYERYGSLAVAENLERCLDDMVRYRRMRHLHPDRDRIRSEFLLGEPTYGRLFALFHGHHAERIGRSRWGDKSLHTELFADDVVSEYPQARIIHMIRDPRDRFASVSRRNGQHLDRVGAATGRWLLSARAARRNVEKHPDTYKVVRFEDLVTDPERVIKDICQFIGEPYLPQVLRMGGVPELRDQGGNSSFGDGAPGAISRKPVGRFREVLTPSEVAFIERVAGREMRRHGYEPTGLRPTSSLAYRVNVLPRHWVRMVGWMTHLRYRLWRGIRVPDRRLTPMAEHAEGATDG